MSRRKVKGPPNRARTVVRKDHPLSSGMDGRHQNLLTQVMRDTDADGVVLLVLGGNKGGGLSVGFKPETGLGNHAVPMLLRSIAEQIESVPETGGTLSEEERLRLAAQFEAERDICGYARRHELKKQAEFRGRSAYEQASRLFSAGLTEVAGIYKAGKLTLADVMCIGAIALELYRETLIEFGQRAEAEPEPEQPAPQDLH